MRVSNKPVCRPVVFPAKHDLSCLCKGQVYEKKAKKSARDAAEEHARYINLISALGPEISQEK